jgi:hypothetical protein
LHKRIVIGISLNISEIIKKKGRKHMLKYGDTCHVTIKALIPQEDVKFLNMYAPDKRAMKYIKQNLYFKNMSQM